MEIVIGLLILIGALAVGSNSSTSEEGQSGKHIVHSEQPVIENRVQEPCRLSNGRLVQRDLIAKRSPSIPSSSDTTRKAESRCPNE